MSRVVAGSRTTAALAMAVALVSNHVATGQHESKKDASDGPKHKVELNNESVTVLRVQIAARQKIPMHELTPRVAVWLTDAYLKLTFPDGKTDELRVKAGETSWVPGGKHAGENLGDRPIEFIVVVPKAVPKPGPGR
jgi:quercetin dioxygenase-like cupin family protein